MEVAPGVPEQLTNLHARKMKLNAQTEPPFVRHNTNKDRDE
jgi:hypothetical protein